nr:BspA family leucine-rich repeat surface protein [uncultured Carboxylicivirga sp.]
MRRILLLVTMFTLSVALRAQTQRPFITTWKTSDGTITVPVNSDYTYNYTATLFDSETNQLVGELTNQTKEAFFQDLRPSKTYKLEIRGDFPAIRFSKWPNECSKIRSIVQWGDIAWQSMYSSFFGCVNMEASYATDSPDLSNVTDMSQMFYNCASLELLDVSNWDVSMVTKFQSTFYKCGKLTTLDVSDWDVSNATNMTTVFNMCTSLIQLDVANWDVSNVTLFNGTFSYCYSLSSLDVSGWDVSNSTNFYGMFNGCKGLRKLDVASWNVSNATSMGFMFQYCSYIGNLDVSGWDVSKVESMEYMFSMCSGLYSIDVSNWDVGNVTDMENIFYYCYSLEIVDVSNWDVSNVTTLDGAFYNCKSLEALDVNNWNVSKVTSMAKTFELLTKITALDLSNWDVSKVTNLDNTFDYCKSLHTLDLSGWKIGNVTSMTNIIKDVPLSVQSYNTLLSSFCSGIDEHVSNGGAVHGFTLNASECKYSTAKASRNKLISDYGWIIIDGGLADYKVKFVDWNGTVLKTETVEYGSDATAPTAPTRTGYTFTGWDVAFDNVTENITVTALYELATGISTNKWVSKIYPNPASSSIIITLPAGSYRLSVYSADGQEVLMLDGIEDGAKLSIDGLKDGVYMMRITQDGKACYTHKFIKN